jgi:hypothetical protein
VISSSRRHLIPSLSIRLCDVTVGPLQRSTTLLPQDVLSFITDKGLRNIFVNATESTSELTIKTGTVSSWLTGTCCCDQAKLDFYLALFCWPDWATWALGFGLWLEELNFGENFGVARTR